MILYIASSSFIAKCSGIYIDTGIDGFERLHFRLASAIAAEQSLPTIPIFRTFADTACLSTQEPP
jgi:hypothetical protein